MYHGLPEHTQEQTILKFKYIDLFVKGFNFVPFNTYLNTNPIRLGGSKSTHSDWGVNLTPLKSRRWGQKSPRLWLHIDIWFLNSVLSHFGARYDKKWKIYQSKFEKSEKKSKIFGVKNFELDMLDTVFRPQEHDALG